MGVAGRAVITGVNHVTLAVADLPRSFAFYRDVLDLMPRARWETGAYLCGGDLWLALIAAPQRGAPVARDYSHVAFSCKAEDFEDLCIRLQHAAAPIWSDNRSEGDSYYFLDPDGHQLEIHVGDLESRLRAMKAEPRGEIAYFETG